MKFEQSVKRIDEIISAMENPDIPLEESVKLYREGIKLAADCRKELDSAELLVTVDDGETE